MPYRLSMDHQRYFIFNVTAVSWSILKLSHLHPSSLTFLMAQRERGSLAVVFIRQQKMFIEQRKDKDPFPCPWWWRHPVAQSRTRGNLPSRWSPATSLPLALLKTPVLSAPKSAPNWYRVPRGQPREAQRQALGLAKRHLAFRTILLAWTPSTMRSGLMQSSSSSSSPSWGQRKSSTSGVFSPLFSLLLPSLSSWSFSTRNELIFN